MREEEKLARDVYRTLGAKWALNPFLHIQRSEEHHLAVVGDLVARAGVEDPAGDDATGVFERAETRALYAKLVREGQSSPVAALRVGAWIEEADIADLEDALSSARNPELRGTYQGLLRASRNHLRAFMRNLNARGETYVPRRLPKERFEAILAGDHETCGHCGDDAGTVGSGLRERHAGSVGCGGCGGGDASNRGGAGKDRGKAAAGCRGGGAKGCLGGRG